MKTAVFECYAGASGDMFLGAWLDLGIDRTRWQGMLSQLHVSGYEIDIQSVKKQGITATKVHVRLPDMHEESHPDAQDSTEGHHSHHVGHTHSAHHDGHRHSHPHRHLADIEHILSHSDLPQPVLQKSFEAFRCLAEAEGRVHDMPPTQVHFHEVGAIDAIVDIVGSMIGWYLAGMPECYVSAIEAGSGTVRCAHGRMPVPAPATAELMKGFVTYSNGIEGETLTPTGAAIIKALCKPADRPHLVVRETGYGAGSKDFPVANVLRIQLGDSAGQASAHNEWFHEEMVVIEANLDDATPELLAYVVQHVLDHGATDAWVTPIIMKKGRAGQQLTVLCATEERDACIRMILEQTTTIGVRYYDVQRAVLPRQMIEVDTPYGSVPVKVATLGGQMTNAAPEFEVCRSLADTNQVPLKHVYQAAMASLNQGRKQDL